MHHAVTDDERLMYGTLRAKLEVCIGRLLASSNLAECESHLLWLPATGGQFFLSERHAGVQFDYNNFEHDEDKTSGFFSYCH